MDSPIGLEKRHDGKSERNQQRDPLPFSSLSTLISMFSAKGLSARDMTTLSGGHTIGHAQCPTFRTHIYNETNIEPSFASLRKRTSSASVEDSNLAPLDVQTPNLFGNDYFKNLVAQREQLHSDQELFNGGSQDALVRTYIPNGALFASDFATAMVKMGGLTR